jgi:hypothetical protein
MPYRSSGADATAPARPRARIGETVQHGGRLAAHTAAGFEERDECRLRDASARTGLAQDEAA